MAPLSRTDMRQLLRMQKCAGDANSEERRLQTLLLAVGAVSWSNSRDAATPAGGE
jgi:hypothetical protein